MYCTNADRIIITGFVVVRRPHSKCFEAGLDQILNYQSYFRPWYIENAGWLQDGGLTYNNPVSLAIQGAAALYPDGPKPSLIVSLGTGFSSPQNAESDKVCGDLYPVRLYKAFGMNMSSGRAWKQHMGYQPTNKKGDYFRYDIDWEGTEPALDSTSQMEEIETAAHSHISEHPSLRNFSGRVRAELFYFELKCIPTYEGSFLCKGHILCRLEGKSPAIRKFLQQLNQDKAHFKVQGRQVNLDFEAYEGRDLFCEDLMLFTSTRQESFHISLVAATGEHPISGSPFNINKLVEAQQLDAQFGTPDYRKPDLQYRRSGCPQKRRSQDAPTKRKRRKLTKRDEIRILTPETIPNRLG